ncbi:hypothetical protein E1A91_A12G145200v1 [Gossypium mustelinum]|uniref:Uncharacterized protein n=1 Tax=Gossypium mustelinum TaxID=34275 RepID=A0A5D2WU20_GOSMU|nr:hypothetical protein E1A91_A12G145200v1 [Gossypium mustelinum]
MDSLFAYWLDIIRKTLVFSKLLVYISHQMVLFSNVYLVDSTLTQSEHSYNCPTFIREGTPNELNTISTGLPYCK